MEQIAFYAIVALLVIIPGAVVLKRLSSKSTRVGAVTPPPPPPPPPPGGAGAPPAPALATTAPAPTGKGGIVAFVLVGLLLIVVACIAIYAVISWIGTPGMPTAPPEAPNLTDPKGPFSEGGHSLYPALSKYHFTKEVLPAEEALAVICGWESNNGVPPGKQFKDGTKEPIMNYEGSDAIGMCQIDQSEHEAKAKELVLSLKTREGNWAYAVWLYNNKDGTHHWEFNEDRGWGRYKWGAQLYKLAVKRGTRQSDLLPEKELKQIDASKDWGRPEPIRASPGYTIRWEEVEGKPYCVRVNGKEEFTFCSTLEAPLDEIPADKVAEIKYAYSLAFQAEGGARMRLFLTPNQ